MPGPDHDHQHGPDPFLPRWRGLRRRLQPGATTVAALRALEPGVLGGLVMEYAEPVRADRHAEDHEVFWAVEAALEAATRGARPITSRTEPPRWLHALLWRMLRDQDSIGPAVFGSVRLLERVGLVDLQADDVYVGAFTFGLLDGGEPAAYFRDDPELIEKGFWRLFETEGTAELSLTNLSLRWDGPRNPWNRACLALLDAGLIERDRLLDAALGAHGREFSAFRTRWFAELVKLLEPTVAELATRQPVLRSLLRSEVGPTLTQTLRWLTALLEAGRLDTAATTEALVPATLARAKSTALAALRLATAIRASDPQVDVVPPARSALRHPSPDVQRAAVALLYSAGADGLVRDDADLLDPVVAHELGLLTAVDDPDPDVDGTGPESGGSPALRAVGPTDLVERFAALLERPDDALEVELVLDRLSRDGGRDLLAPLVKRATTVLRGGFGDWEGDDWLAGQLARLVLATGERGRVGTGSAVPRHRTTRFLYERLQEVRLVLVGAAAPRPLLARPDDGAGWVEPEALLARLRAHPDPPPYDLTAALLRLAPAGRSAALRRLHSSTDLPSSLRLVLGHALGSDAATPADVVTDPAHYWVAASRARAPLAEDDVLVRAGLGAAGQGRPLVCGFEVQRRIVERHWSGESERETSFRLQVSGAISSRRSDRDGRQPTAVAATTSDGFFSPRGDRIDGPWHPWVARIWPHDAEHFLAGAVPDAFYAAQWTTAGPDHPWILAALAAHPGRLGPLAAATVALSLSAGTLPGRVQAVDLLIDLLGRQRLAGPQLVDAMVAVAEACVLTRWADSLRRAADAGAARWVAELLLALLPRLERGTHGLHALLELLHGELVRAGAGVPPGPVQAYLEMFAGSSKAARTARALLAL